MDADADHLDATRIRGSRDRDDQRDARGVYVRRVVPHSAQPHRRASANRWLVSPAGTTVLLPQGA